MPTARIIITLLVLFLAQEVARADLCMVRADETRALRRDDRGGPRPGTCAMECEQRAEAIGETCLDGDGDPEGCEAIARDALDDCLGSCIAPAPTCAETCEMVAHAGDEAAFVAHGDTPGRASHSRRLLRRCVRRCTA